MGSRSEGVGGQVGWQRTLAPLPAAGTFSGGVLSGNVVESTASPGGGPVMLGPGDRTSAPPLKGWLPRTQVKFELKEGRSVCVSVWACALPICCMPPRVPGGWKLRDTGVFVGKKKGYRRADGREVQRPLAAEGAWCDLPIESFAIRGCRGTGRRSGCAEWQAPR